MTITTTNVHFFCRSAEVLTCVWDDRQTAGKRRRELPDAYQRRGVACFFLIASLIITAHCPLPLPSLASPVPVDCRSFSLSLCLLRKKEGKQKKERPAESPSLHRLTSHRWQPLSIITKTAVDAADAAAAPAATFDACKVNRERDDSRSQQQQQQQPSSVSPSFCVF